MKSITMPKPGLIGVILCVASFVVACAKTDQSSESTLTPPGYTELAYENGDPVNNNAPWSDEAGGQVAVRFTPPAGEAKLIKVGFFVAASGVPEREFGVRVYRADSHGVPDSTDLLGLGVTAAADAKGDEWVWVDLATREISVSGGDFFVAMEWLTPPGDHGRDAQFIATNPLKPTGRSWWRHVPARPWVPISDIGPGDRDLLIRAVVTKKN
jgi:hypothetical protein